MDVTSTLRTHRTLLKVHLKNVLSIIEYIDTCPLKLHYTLLPPTLIKWSLLL